MSLLGSNVYANPTAPLWGGGGGPGPNPTFNSVTFIAQGPPFVSTTLETTTLDSLGSAVSVVDASGNLGPLAAGSFYAEPAVGFGARVAYKKDRIDFEDAAQTPYSLATVNGSSNGWNLSNISSVNSNYITFNPSASEMDLSNVNSINARPVPLTVTAFNQAFSSPPIASFPGTVMVGQSFTAPADGKLFVQGVGNFQSTITTGTSVAVSFDVNGTSLSNSIIYASCGNLILEVAPSTMAQFNVTGGTVYDVSLIGFSSTSSGDWNGISGQLFLSFTTS